MRLIPIGTKTNFGEVSAIHSKCGERQYFMTDHRGTVTLLPEDSMFCKCHPRFVVGIKKNHPTENNSILIGRKLRCKYCGYFEL